MKWERPRRTMNVGRNCRRKPPRKSETAPCLVSRWEAERPPMISEAPPMVVRGGCGVVRKVTPSGKTSWSIHAIGIRATRDRSKSPNRTSSTCRRNSNRLRDMKTNLSSSSLSGRRYDPSRRRVNPP